MVGFDRFYPWVVPPELQQCESRLLPSVPSPQRPYQRANHQGLEELEILV